MKHVLLNPERYRLPDYPFIEKSEKGCSSAGVGTVDRGGVEEDGSYHLRDIRLFYQGNQCVFLFKDNGGEESNSLYSTTNFDLYIYDNKSFSGVLKDCYFSMFKNGGEILENPTKISNSYHLQTYNDMIITKEDVYTDGHYYLRFGGFGTGNGVSLVACIQDGDITRVNGNVNIETIMSSKGYKKLYVIPVIDGAFEIIDLNPIFDSNGTLIIIYDSYSYNCGCLDLNIKRFE